MTHALEIGTVLEVDGGRYTTTKQFVVEGYNENDYMKIACTTDKRVFMTIHPAHAARIAANGIDSGIKVLDTTTLNDVKVKLTDKKIVPAVAPIVTKSKVVSTPTTGSKKERALAIKAAHPNATRKELIAMFIEQLDMTPAGASTYASYK